MMSLVLSGPCYRIVLARALASCLRRREGAAGDSSSRSSSCRATEDASYAGCDGYEAAFANPENNKTGILDDNLSKKLH